jgi:AraC-like DNA-binding protein
MFETHFHADVSENAPDTRETVLRASDCPLLAEHRIAHAGWIHTSAPFRRVRVRPSGSYIQVCLAGEGQILLDGRWQDTVPGTVCLAPPRVLNAFHAVPGKEWHFFWVRYTEPPGVEPVVHAASPVRTQCDPEILASAIRGLWAESRGAAEPRFLALWLDLLVGEVHRLSRPWRRNERLAGVWSTVAANLAHPWSGKELARLAHCSAEHLRRLCLRELGRTPMQHVTALRIQRAASRLLSPEAKLAQIAEETGYSDGFVLSKVFRKWTGASPANYRRNQNPRMPPL